MEIVHEFYDKQEQQTMIVNLKSQLIELEKENNKLTHLVEDTTDENDIFKARIQKIEADLEQQRQENEEEAKAVEYDNEQRKILDSYESLLK